MTPSEIVITPPKLRADSANARGDTTKTIADAVVLKLLATFKFEGPVRELAPKNAALAVTWCQESLAKGKTLTVADVRAAVFEAVLGGFCIVGSRFEEDLPDAAPGSGQFKGLVARNLSIAFNLEPILRRHLIDDLEINKVLSDQPQTSQIRSFRNFSKAVDFARESLMRGTRYRVLGSSNDSARSDDTMELTPLANASLPPLPARSLLKDSEPTPVIKARSAPEWPSVIECHAALSVTLVKLRALMATHGHETAAVDEFEKRANNFERSVAELRSWYERVKKPQSARSQVALLPREDREPLSAAVLDTILDHPPQRNLKTPTVETRSAREQISAAGKILQSIVPQLRQILKPIAKGDEQKAILDVVSAIARYLKVRTSRAELTLAESRDKARDQLMRQSKLISTSAPQPLAARAVPVAPAPSAPAGEPAPSLAEDPAKPRLTLEDVRDLLVRAKNSDWVEILLEDGRALQGSVVYNVDTGMGRLINVDEEFSYDFSESEVSDVKF